MSCIYIFSKSDWREVPRLRHQLTNLVRDLNLPIYFFQKPNFGFNPFDECEVETLDGIHIARTRQLIHHQLRWTFVQRLLNSIFEKLSIKRLVDKIPSPVLIINFNYDYFFLRDLFPRAKIITVLNDDFVAQSKFFNGYHVKKVLAKTCGNSDSVLVVSEPIFKQVSDYCKPILFLPWSDTPYRISASNSVGHHILFWAHIDGRVDFDLISSFLKSRPEYHLDIVGPISKNVETSVKELVDNNMNVSLLGLSSLDELMLSKYFCSIIPYKNNVDDILAVTISNKTFQLLSRGFPIVTHGMPNFYVNPAIKKTSNSQEFVVALDQVKANFYDLQSDIQKLVEDNSSVARLASFKNLL